MKFNNKHTVYEGISFDSLDERTRYQQLRLLQQAGQISGLRVHPRYLLVEKFIDAAGVKHRAIYYEGDFEYVEDGQIVCEDVKGRNRKTGKFVVTAVAKLKLKMFASRYPHIKLVLVEA